jgi:hypothetical protein
MPRSWNGHSDAFAGLSQAPAGGKGACVSTTLRDGPPDFQWRSGNSSNQPSASSTASCTA